MTTRPPIQDCRILFGLLCFLLAAWPVMAQTSRREKPTKRAQDRDVSAPSEEQMVKIESQALQVADNIIRKAKQEIEKLARKRKPDAEDAALRERYQQTIDYNETLKTKIETAREIEAFQERCRREKRFDEAAISHLTELDEQYQAAVKRLRELATTYRQTYGNEVPDALGMVLRKYYKPDLER